MNYVGIDWAYRRAAWCSMNGGGAIKGEGMISADEGGLARLVLECGTEVRGLRRDDQRRGLGKGPERGWPAGRSRSPMPARSEMSPRFLRTPTRSTPAFSPSFAGATWSRRSGSPGSRTARSQSGFAAAPHLVKLRTSHRNRIFGLLTQFGLRISFTRLLSARCDGVARAPRRGRRFGASRSQSTSTRSTRCGSGSARSTAELRADRQLRRESKAVADDPRRRAPDRPRLCLRDRRGLALVRRPRSWSATPALLPDHPVGRPLGDRATFEGRLANASLGGGRGRQSGLAANQPLPRSLPPPRRKPRRQPGQGLRSPASC